MNTSNRIIRLADDLAGYWTEPALEILNTAGKVHMSVQREIDTWHTLNAALQTELRDQPAFGATDSFSTVKERVFARTISELAGDCDLNEERIRHSAHELRSTPAEQDLFRKLVGQPAGWRAVSSARQTDFVPRLQLAAVAG